ncbi:hypothetical protein LIER_20222 [Lithospermum erythrorhizon]|uniref:Uncharacterized protein n=1 Tax=Lithospermum erythrorhizon TaxID=34254 RepID=A0AAV3QP80_LITER
MMLPDFNKAYQGANGGRIIIQESHGGSDRNLCTLQVLEGSPKKGQPHEDVQSVPFDENNPTKVFKIGTTLGGRARGDAYLGSPGVPGYICLGTQGYDICRSGSSGPSNFT